MERGRGIDATSAADERHFDFGLVVSGTIFAALF
jgi:hypothetical protein